MLAALIPGVREVRTPLVTGLLYLLVAWLFFGPEDLVPSVRDSDLADRALALGDLFGATAGLAVLSFGAYLIGSLLTVSDWRSLLPSRRRRARDESLGDGSKEAAPPSSTEFEIRTWIDRRVLPKFDQGLRADQLDRDRRLMGVEFARALQGVQGRADLDRAEHLEIDPPPPGHRANGTTGATQEEIDDWEFGKLGAVMAEVVAGESEVLATRLQIEAPNLYDDYSRLRSESELRFSIATPLILIVGAVAWLWTPWVLPAVLIPLLLFRQGSRTFWAADRLVWQALIHDVISSPAMTRFESITPPGDGGTSVGPGGVAATSATSPP